VGKSLKIRLTGQTLKKWGQISKRQKTKNKKDNNNKMLIKKKILFDIYKTKQKYI
jgi:hypothetical protein